MRGLFTIGIITLTVNLYAQQTPKKYVGPYNFEENEGTATYTYIEQNGERVMDGAFTFTSSNLKTTVIGKYIKGSKSGLWTKKETFSRYNGMPVVKTDLKWQKVTENIPFKETTDIKTENFVNDKLEGTTTQTTTVKNSWGYPAPGGSSVTMYVIKKNYLANDITNIEATRKQKDKINLSLKGSYKNNFADGNWLFNDNKNTSNYDFKDGYLASYEIKEIGTGKIIESKKIELDNNLINDYFNKSDNSFEVKFGRFYSELKNGKVIVKKVNENLNVIKLCELKNVSANFINLDLSIFTSAFGIITPYVYNYYDQFAFSPKIDCKTDADYDLIYFNDIKSEYSFLKLATNSKGQFLNIDWQKVSNFSKSPVYYQLKYYLYSGDTTGLNSFLKIFNQNSNFEDYIDSNPIPNGKYVNIGNSEKEFYEYLKFLIDLTLGNEENYKKTINENYNKIFGGKKWQNFIITQLDSITKLTSFKYNKEQLLVYVSKKEKEIESYNNKITQNIKTISIGDQIWMAEDLKVIPNNIDYNVYPQDTITSLLKLYPGFNNGWNDAIKDEGNYYKLKIGNYKYVFVSSKMINETSSPKYFTSAEVVKLCPLGWHLPTEKDFDKLNINLGGDKITTDKMLKIGGGSGFEAKELNFIYFNTVENKPWVFEGFDQNVDYQKKRYGPTPKLYAKCRCIKD